jgi:hypothetical protein
MLKKLFSKKNETNFEEVLALSAATTALCSRIVEVTQSKVAPLDMRKAVNFNHGFIKTPLDRMPQRRVA